MLLNHRILTAVVTAGLISILAFLVQVNARMAVIEAVHITLEQRFQRIELKLDRLLEGRHP